MHEQELLEAFKAYRVEAHQRLFAVVDELDYNQFRWQPAQTLPSIAFHVWHLGRWADFDRVAIGGGEQIWVAERLAQRWGLPSSGLGVAETGMGMGDAMTPALARVPSEQVQEYAFRCLRALDDAVASLAPTDLRRTTSGATGDSRDIVTVLLGHFAHDNRHLGMIEALRGMQGLSGTATD